jgi:mRNA-degrading endonuclease RelE of RelBE toxin-antitoxin system
MSFSVIPSEKFKREAKKLIKKYASLKSELLELATSLSNTPDLGTPLGNNSFKIRISIKSKGKGKSGGARVITYLITENKEVYLLTIYDKAQFESIDDKALKNIIETLRGK